MARNFTLDLRGFQGATARIPHLIARGGKRALDDIKDDWVREARDVAPIDTSNLRQQIHGEVEGQNLQDLQTVVAGNAMDDGLNYGYFIHEQNMGGKNPRVPGTVKKFLDVPANQREDEWMKWLEEEIQAEIRQAGW